MSYNSGKTFNIDGEIDFFLTEAMNAAAAVADHCTLTENSHVLNPEYGQIYNWNPYYEMFSTPDASGYSEVLLWKQYDKSLNVSHCAPARLQNGDRTGLTRGFITTFLMKSGLPIYAAGDEYHGDVSISDEKKIATNVCNCLYGVKKMYCTVIPKPGCSSSRHNTAFRSSEYHLRTETDSRPYRIPPT